MNLVVGRRYTFDYIVREYCRANKMAMSDLRFEFSIKIHVTQNLTRNHTVQ